MPVLFIGHGSPMNALADNGFTKFLDHLGKELPLPRAILVISAHWETAIPRVSSGDAPRTIHDFRGFPPALFAIQYPAPGSGALTARVAGLTGAAPDEAWGLDHGAWAVLGKLFPRADIPVLQLSLGKGLSMGEHYELGTRLKPLREEGVLILASGNITHNLSRLNPESEAPPAPWAQAFDERIATALANHDLPGLTSQIPEELWQLAHPELDHYLPLLYAVGAGEDSGPPSFPFEGFHHGTLSMRAVRYG
ncbi:MAG: 4,5-DOPA dioxygenase extradiol [Proteobacteria bacterium]|nr:MAG: 4,5-DOPA dioxygenase extradiol [Pseudomonadota bacterium]